MTKTKIVATLGPASANADMIGKLMQGGVNVFRLNFSHGTLEDHGQTLEIINEMRQSCHQPVAVMGDLCGPKIRTGNIVPDGEIIKTGETVTIEPSVTNGTPNHFGSNYQALCADVKFGDRVLIDDGKISLKVTKIDKEQIICQVKIGGPIKSHKGINLPDSKISAPSITPRDYECAQWAVEHDLDFLALSFVRTAKEILELREFLREKDSPIKLVSKIEKPQAVAQLEDIIRASDVALVARGDLGVEMELAKAPLIQKRITAMCRRLGKPVIVATQMLESMIDSPCATRAEVSDIANAIMDFTDAVMLSGETAVGKYPLEAVETMRQVAKYTETYMDEIDEPRPKVEGKDYMIISGALARSVAQIIDDISAKMVVAWSETGTSAGLLSKARVDVPILAFSSDPKVCNQMCMSYGVIPICHEPIAQPREFVAVAEKIIAAHTWAQPGDKIVFIANTALTGSSENHAVLVHKVE